MSAVLGYSGVGTSCCANLAHALPGIVTLPGNATYATILGDYWSQQESALQPSCILTPSTTAQIATALPILTQGQCPLAIKGQGHAPASGFANVQNGVTIDMSGLNSVAVSPGNDIVQIGAGNAWLDVYEYLNDLGLAVAGGRNGAVGVGGLTVGGGISHFSPRVGFVCDTVVNFEIVLASGEVTNANATSNSDLFRALKGGANNFGIVTRFDLQAFHQGEIWGGSLVHTIDQREAVFKAFSDIAGAKDFDENTSLVAGFIYNSSTKGWIIGNGVVYTEPVENPEVFAELLAIPRVSDSVTITNLSVLANEGKGLDPKFNWVFYTGTYGVSAPLMSKIFDTLNSTLSAFDIPGGIAWSIAFEPLPTAITKHGDFNGGNSLGTEPMDGNGFIMLLSPLWSDASSNDLVQNTAQDLGKRIAAVARDEGLLHRFQYLNYADPSQDPIGSYGYENVDFLRSTSKKYDPRSVFQKQVKGGFKLDL